MEADGRANAQSLQITEYSRSSFCKNKHSPSYSLKKTFNKHICYIILKTLIKENHHFAENTEVAGCAVQPIMFYVHHVIEHVTLKGMVQHFGKYDYLFFWN